MEPAAAYKYPRLDPALYSLLSSFLQRPTHLHESRKPIISPKQRENSSLKTSLYSKMAHGCSCGDSCQCPAGQCNCPKN
ncbi:hypothetical protein BJX99DRAFT_224861 [Aspergillus californicus]